MSTHNTCKTRTRECESLMGKYSCKSEFGFSDPKYSRVRVRVTHECTRGQPWEVATPISMGFYISTMEAADPISMEFYISTMEAADPISMGFSVAAAPTVSR